MCMIHLTHIYEIMCQAQLWVAHWQARFPSDLQHAYLRNLVLQAYMVCKLEEKVDVLWSFLKTHLKVGRIFILTCMIKVYARMLGAEYFKCLVKCLELLQAAVAASDVSTLRAWQVKVSQV